MFWSPVTSSLGERDSRLWWKMCPLQQLSNVLNSVSPSSVHLMLSHMSLLLCQSGVSKSSYIELCIWVRGVKVIWSPVPFSLGELGSRLWWRTWLQQQLSNLHDSVSPFSVHSMLSQMCLLLYRLGVYTSSYIVFDF